MIPKKKGEQKREDCQALEEDKCLAVKGQTGGEFSAAEGQTSESQRGEKCLEEDESDEVQMGDKCSAVEGQTGGECSDVDCSSVSEECLALKVKRGGECPTE